MRSNNRSKIIIIIIVTSILGVLGGRSSFYLKRYLEDPFLKETTSKEQLFDVEIERNDALSYLNTLKIPRSSYELVYKGLSLPADFFDSKIEDKRVVEKSVISDQVELSKFRIILSNGFRFSYLQLKNLVQEPERTLIFLHGNECYPGELLGIKESIYADPVALDMAKSGIQVVIPFKYNMYRQNYVDEIIAKASLVGTTLEALEQIKIRSLLTLYRDETKQIEVLGFSHGAWQGVLAGLLNEFDVLYIVDFLVDPNEWLTAAGCPDVYKNFNASIASLFNYAEIFDLLKVSRVFILLGNESPYSSNRTFIEEIQGKVNKDRISINYYDGGHYLNRETVCGFVIGKEE